MRIGELAARAGVSVRALRYYEEQGLLTAGRSTSGQRHYPAGAVERVRWIQSLYAAGLPSKRIVEFLPCVVTGTVTPDVLDRLAGERDRMSAQISELVATRDRLDAMIDAALAHRDGRPCASASETSAAAQPA